MTRSRWLALAAIVTGVGLAGGALYVTRAPRPPALAVDAIPADAFAAIDVHLDALRRSGALSALFGASGEQSVTKACGFDPVDRMHEIVFALPETGDGDFGVAVQADLGKDELLACARKVIETRGGATSTDVATRGTYTVVAQRLPPGDARLRPALAYRDGGPYLVGVGEWLGKMIDAVERPSASAAPDPHAALRKSLSGPAGTSFAVTGTVVLLKSIREKVRAQMIGEGESLSDSGAATMAGILAISSAAIGLYEQGDQVRAVAELVCEDAAACTAVQKFLLRKQDTWSKDPKLRLFGVATALDHLEIDHHDAHLEVRASAPTVQVVQWVKAVLEPRPPP
jgi:hypothetical protein